MSPRRLLSPCGQPGCPAIAIPGIGRCEAHQPKPWARPGVHHAGGRRWQETRRRIFARDGHRCVYCHGPAEVVDHVLARAAGGTDDDSNLAASCKPCNEQKRKQEARAGRGLGRGVATPTTSTPTTVPARDERYPF